METKNFHIRKGVEFLGMHKNGKFIKQIWTYTNCLLVPANTAERWISNLNEWKPYLGWIDTLPLGFERITLLVQLCSEALGSCCSRRWPQIRRLLCCGNFNYFLFPMTSLATTSFPATLGSQFLSFFLSSGFFERKRSQSLRRLPCFRRLREGCIFRRQCSISGDFSAWPEPRCYPPNLSLLTVLNRYFSLLFAFICLEFKIFVYFFRLCSEV